MLPHILQKLVSVTVQLLHMAARAVMAIKDLVAVPYLLHPQLPFTIQQQGLVPLVGTTTLVVAPRSQSAAKVQVLKTVV